MNYANDDRFSKETLKFLINQLNSFVDSLKGILLLKYIISSKVGFKFNSFKKRQSN